MRRVCLTQRGAVLVEAVAPPPTDLGALLGDVALHARPGLAVPVLHEAVSAAGRAQAGAGRGADEQFAAVWSELRRALVIQQRFPGVTLASLLSYATLLPRTESGAQSALDAMEVAARALDALREIEPRGDVSNGSGGGSASVAVPPGGMLSSGGVGAGALQAAALSRAALGLVSAELQRAMPSSALATFVSFVSAMCGLCDVEPDRLLRVSPHDALCEVALERRDFSAAEQVAVLMDLDLVSLLCTKLVSDPKRCD